MTFISLYSINVLSLLVRFSSKHERSFLINFFFIHIYIFLKTVFYSNNFLRINKLIILVFF